jgi:hypothetical protein
MPREELTKPLYKNVIRYLGDAGSAPDIRRRRRWTGQTMRRLGTPVLVKHMYTIDDVKKEPTEAEINDGTAAKVSPNFDSAYAQSTHDDPFSHGVGYVSWQTTEGLEPQEWIQPATERKQSTLVQGAFQEGFVPAPLYRGYGPGYLTYVILPDAPIDVFKLTDEGALIRTQQARVNLPWYPEVGDNDLLITVELDAAERIIKTGTRYQLKKVSPITMRGRDRLGRQELGQMIEGGGNRYRVGQFCEANKVPETEPIYEVETDR